ncbi:MAG: hypothetical protein R3D51_00830 [Hyphomicrobiaceae bacterium]
MATIALHGFVRANQLKVGELVIECLRVELEDVSLAALVIRMAVLALDFPNVRSLAMKTRPCADVFGDVLVTIEAEPSLAFFGKGLVAALALVFELGMTFDDIARRDQLLKQALGPGGARGQQGYCHADYQD